MRKPGATSGLVYSTEGGRMCPSCRRPVADCACAAPRAAPPTGVARVGREKAGRGGKTVTVVRDLPLDDAALAALGRRLKAACGTGGTTRDGVLELQGDHRDAVLAFLAAEGHAAKRAGG
ncbi:MAG: translation initiation factor Sui1 [Caldimonas sp.]